MNIKALQDLETSDDVTITNDRGESKQRQRGIRLNAGEVYDVTTGCGNRLIALGVAEASTAPGRKPD